MAKLTDVAEGLQILAKYCKPGSHDISAGHDIIYAGPSMQGVELGEGGECTGGDPVVSPEDIKRLDELGWFIDAETESWARFV